MEITKQPMTPNIKFLSRMGYHRKVVQLQVLQSLDYNLISN
jgi:hypothetical protein